jgi:hypothetical protein
LVVLSICADEKLTRLKGVKIAQMKYKKYPYLMVRLKNDGHTFVEVARTLNTTPASLSNKLNGKADFRLSELETIIFDILHETNNEEICKLLNIHNKKFA